jgi:hypothetical protein
METLVMTTLEDCKAKFSNVPANGFSHAALIPLAEHEPSQLDRIEKRLDAITELLAVLLDSVQDEECCGIGHGPCDCNILDAANLDEELTANGYMGQ